MIKLNHSMTYYLRNTVIKNKVYLIDSVSLHRKQKYIENFFHRTPIHRHRKMSHRKFFHRKKNHRHTKFNYIENWINEFLLVITNVNIKILFSSFFIEDYGLIRYF
jgi:hypothetical protein